MTAGVSYILYGLFALGIIAGFFMVVKPILFSHHGAALR